MSADAKPVRWKTVLAYAIIYVVWGSTFLAIRVGVREVPPFLLAAMRFLAAGLALFCWTMARGERFPSPRHWVSAFLLAVLIFLIDYGGVFWAEQRVPSGVTAVIMATIPIFMTLSEILVLRKRVLTLRVAGALAIGMGGVAVVVSHSRRLGGVPIDAAGAAALLISAASFSISSALTRKLTLPESRFVSSGAQMLAGGILLAAASAALGEFRNFHPLAVSRGAWLSLLYLVVAGSIVAFTAYVWLIHHESPTRVGTYAYVNPVVAVLLGYFLGGEALGPRTILGTVLVLVSVVLITTAPAVPVSKPARQAVSSATRA